MWKLENLQPFNFYSIEEYMYNYLVEYNVLFALLYVFRKISCLYGECSDWNSIEL
jgi:hypothetical protein